MKSKLYLTVLLVALCLFGCKSRAKFVISPEDANDVVTLYAASAEDFFRVVPDTYVMEVDGSALQVEMVFEVQEKVTMNKDEQFDSFVFIPKDKDDEKLGDKIAFNAVNGREVVTKLFDVPEGTKVPVTFQYDPVDRDERDFILENISSCDINLKFIEISPEKE